MCRFIETIRIEKGAPALLTLHQERMERVARAFPTLEAMPSLEEHLSTVAIPESGLWKCRITYSDRIEKTELEPYRTRPIKSLKLTEAGHLRYDHKFADRAAIDRLVRLRGEADDILIVRDRLLTDTSYCNVALWDGSGWYTPLRPLLAGVRRASLISAGLVTPANIAVEDLVHFETIRLFNAMLSFGEAIELPTSFIFS